MFQRRLSFSFLGFALSAFVVVHLGAFSASATDGDRPKRVKPVLTDNGRPYVHACASGTEPVGVVGKQMWCRQPIVGGFRRQGGFIEWYANGKPRSAGDFQRDRKHGIWTRYYPNGKKREEIEYYNGKEIRKTKYDRRGKKLDNTAAQEKQAKEKEMRQKLREAHSWRKPREWH